MIVATTTAVNGTKLLYFIVATTKCCYCVVTNANATASVIAAFATIAVTLQLLLG